jgi:RNA polymerase sigma factor (sigma-70 family)
MSSEDFREAAFADLFDEFYTDLFRVAWRICGRPEVAEELCQEAFLRYYERRDRLPVGDEARYWLIRVVKNLAFNYEKRLGREREAYRVYAREPRVESRNEGENFILAEESRDTVRKALLEIPYKLRVALILKEYSGYPYIDIARILHISEGNVKIRVFRARQHLSKILQKGEVHVP